jgi:hypothetical protein
MDTLDRGLVVAGGDEHDRRATHIAQPARRLDAFTPAFEADVDQGYVGLVAHGERACAAVARRKRAHFETEV